MNAVWKCGRKQTHPFQFPHNPANCGSECVKLGVRQKHKCALNCTSIDDWRVEINYSILVFMPLWTSGRRHARPHERIAIWMIVMLICRQFKSLARFRHRSLGECVWFIIEPISREIFLCNRIRTENEIENVRHVDGKAYQSDTRWRQRHWIPSIDIGKRNCRLDFFSPDIGCFEREMFSILINFIVASSIILSLRMDWKRKKKGKINKNGNCECETTQST